MEIETGVPAPKHKTRKPIRPFAAMSVGDSVIYEPGVEGRKMQNYCHVYGASSGKKFATEKQECGGIRIWRVE